MQTGTALRALGRIFPALHQPLPLSKRETQRLIDAMKTSFREQLDQEYSRSRPADRHLSAILKNPLFTLGETSRPPEGSPHPPWDSHKAVFEKAVGRGLMTIPRAHGFLKLVDFEVRTWSPQALLDGVAPTGAGRLVLQWLRSSGQERDLSFLADRPFSRQLVRAMAADNLDGVVWEWVERLAKEGHASGQENQTIESLSLLLQWIVEAKYQGIELDEAFSVFLKGEAMVKENSLALATLKRAWIGLAWQTTVEAWKHAKPRADLFQPFAEVGTKLPANLWMRAYIDLNHPTKPSPQLAVGFVLDEDNWKRVAESQIRRFMYGVTSLGIDTFHHLAQTDRMQEATQVMGFLEKHSRLTPLV